MVCLAEWGEPVQQHKVLWWRGWKQFLISRRSGLALQSPWRRGTTAEGWEQDPAACKRGGKFTFFNSEVINHQNKLPRGGEDLPSLYSFKSRLDGFSGRCWSTSEGSKQREPSWATGMVRKTTAAVSPAFEPTNLKKQTLFYIQMLKNK